MTTGHLHGRCRTCGQDIRLSTKRNGEVAVSKLGAAILLGMKAAVWLIPLVALSTLVFPW